MIENFLKRIINFTSADAKAEDKNLFWKETIFNQQLII